MLILTGISDETLQALKNFDLITAAVATEMITMTGEKTWRVLERDYLEFRVDGKLKSYHRIPSAVKEFIRENYPEMFL